MDDQHSSESIGHRYLAAPWRMRYLNRTTPTTGCVFCEKLSSSDDVENLVVWRGQSIAAIMNLYPYTTGHLMLLPYAHIASPEQLDDPAIMTELAQEIAPSMRAMRRVLHCQGFNTGMNTGEAAGAGIAEHLHMHIVPRWSGDANFMAVIADTTVMPETLSVTYAKLRAELTVEHDPSRKIDALVLSADRSRVFVMSETTTLPRHFTSRHDDSLVSQLSAGLRDLGIDAEIAGWVGDATIVWLADDASRPKAGKWVPLGALPTSMGLRAIEAINRLPK